MHIRAIAIIVALSAPVAAISVLAQQATGEAPPQAKPAKHTSISGKMSTAAAAPAQEEKRKLPIRPPASLEEAKERLRMRLADLEKMTEAEWQEEQKRKQQGAGRDRKEPVSKWEKMSPEEKIEAVARRQKAMDARAGRAPEIAPAAAQPVSDIPPPAAIR